MSMELMVKAMKAKVGSPLTKLVLIKLADNANDQGECWPSFKHISDQCEISRSSAIRHIGLLEANGFLRKEHRFGGVKGNSSNLFHLTIENGRVVSQANQGGVTETLGGSVTETPRISHSLETVIEPLSSASPTTDKEIPFQKILDRYQAVCGSVFKPAIKLTDERKKNIRLCWNYSVNGVKVFRNGKFWEIFFDHCLKNKHWRGETGQWKASLEFLTRKSTMEPVVEEIQLLMEQANESA